MKRFEPYTKLFHRILQSSVWDYDERTRIVWITLLAMTDSDGCVIGTVKYVARMARLDRTDGEVDDVRRALDRFMGPDPDSLTSEREGRRLEKIDGGWRLINFGKYRELMMKEARREAWRESKAKTRGTSGFGSGVRGIPLGGETTNGVILKNQGADEAEDHQERMDTEVIERCVGSAASGKDVPSTPKPLDPGEL